MMKTPALYKDSGVSSAILIHTHTKNLKDILIKIEHKKFSPFYNN